MHKFAFFCLLVCTQYVHAENFGELMEAVIECNLEKYHKLSQTIKLSPTEKKLLIDAAEEIVKQKEILTKIKTYN